MDERTAFIVDWQRDEMAVAALCRYYGVSRKTGYKWINRFEAQSWEGLKDASRAPHHHPNAVSEEIEAAIVVLRAKHPHWGPKKLLTMLVEAQPRRAWPAVSTIAAMFERHGLVKHRRRRSCTPANLSPLSPCAAANDVWGMDFKGWFRTGDGRRCDPLSVSDLATRYVVRLQVLPRPDGEHVWPVLDAAFREFGPPKVMRSDNGAPFASTGAGGLTRLAVKLIKVGVVPERIRPGQPQENGRHERLHLTVQIEAVDPPAATARAQQRRFDEFRQVFNQVRPHEALGQTPPARHYHPPPSAYSGRLREPDYPSDYAVRRVRHSGEIKWRGERVFLSEALIGEPVGLAVVSDGLWLVRYGPIELGHVDAAGKFHKPAPRRRKTCGFVDNAGALPTTPQAQQPPQIT